MHQRSQHKLHDLQATATAQYAASKVQQTEQYQVHQQQL
jgi:hypothetical protein